jgi:tetratricopeptide (TPR) repeat protein
MTDRDRSILERLESEGRAVPAVDLPDAGDFGDLRVSDIPLRESGRFQVLGEIAAGGVGQVLKGRDTDLGRDVALKVIHEEHVGTEHVVQRFVEEAQIGGQLQHPGIVPVYELGLQADRRPFFAMKLVKGRTLQALLADRRDPAEDLRRFLAIFEEVCQTVGYAHSRGVIHRDLKPANIMVGAFGEVQVLDWGFAKVLPRGGVADERASRLKAPDLTEIATVRSIGDGSNSIPGSVMGTLAYMPPEQALGQVEQMDERSDVFSLGAILTEILTGAPPYTGEGRDRLIQAAQCRLDDAHARLDACGADETLTDLARQCLSPLTSDRPRHAAAVGEVVRNHLAKAEERARASAIKATRARAEADRAQQEARDQRKLRRLGLALAATVLAVLIAGGGSFAWVAKGRADRAERARSAVSAAMTEAQEHRGREEWPEALRAAKRAAEFARADGVDEETRARAAVLKEAVAAEEAAATAEADQKAKDAALLARLEELRLQRFDWYADQKRIDAGHTEAFRTWGLAVRTDDPEAAGEKVRARGATFAREVAAALDDWSVRSLADPSRSGEDGERLRRLAFACDPDPRLRRLRTLIAENDIRELGKLAAEPETLELPVRSLVLLATYGASGKRNARIRFLQRVGRRHPGDLWVHSVLASWLTSSRRYAEAHRHHAAVVALRPASAAARYNYGVFLHDRLRRYREAEFEFRKAIELYPEYAGAYCSLGNALSNLGRSEEAIAAYEESLRREPDAANTLSILGIELWELGRREKGFAMQKRALALDPNSGVVRGNYGLCLAQSGRLDEALEHYREAVRLRPGYAAPHMNLGMALVYLNHREEGLRHLRYAARLDPEYPRAHGALATALQGSGLHDEAIREHREVIRLLPGTRWASASHNDIAIIHMRRRGYEAAVEELETAIRIDRGSWMAHANLAGCLQCLDRHDEALEAIRRAAELTAAQPGLPDLSSQVRECEELGRLAPRLPAVLAGTDTPANALERARFAKLCLGNDRFAEAARLFAAALEEDASLGRDPDSCYGAATASIRHSVESDGLEPAERARWRGRALAWLRAALETGPAKWGPVATRSVLHSMNSDHAIREVRDPAELAKLPEAERRAWEAFWAEVRMTLARMR